MAKDWKQIVICGNRSLQCIYIQSDPTPIPPIRKFKTRKMLDEAIDIHENVF